MVPFHPGVHEGGGLADREPGSLFCSTPGRSHAPRRAIGGFYSGAGQESRPRPALSYKSGASGGGEEPRVGSVSAPARAGWGRVLKLWPGRLAPPRQGFEARARVPA